MIECASEMAGEREREGCDDNHAHRPINYRINSKYVANLPSNCELIERYNTYIEIYILVQHTTMIIDCNISN